MSEFINNVSRRKEILKNVLRQLHEGRSVEEVKEEFGVLAREAGSSEIAEVEQMLMEDGVAAEEIQKLCDVHVAVFREGLDQHVPPEALPGHPVFTFRVENRHLSRLLDEMQGTLVAAASNPAARPALAQQAAKLTEFSRHYSRKESLLFPYLERLGFTGPSKVMWGIQDEIRLKLKNLAALAANPAAPIEQAAAAFQEVESMMREMVYKEEKILFPAALERLKDPDWKAIRTQEVEIGFFMIQQEPGMVKAAEPAPAKETAAAPSAYAAAASAPQPGLLPLSVGALSLEQVDLMLRNLPVDVTFVDENDEVCFFSQTRERIFERLPAIIGRKVQNCHPPQSLGRVQRILDDFRAGKRESADFWIQMGGKFILIRYFALRDAQGAYRGCLEVTQDVAPIRALEGERRLLDD